MSDEPEILFENRGAVGLITLNRPKALNALTYTMALAMRNALRIWAREDAIRTIVIEGAGERAFCAGGDIRWLYDNGKAGMLCTIEFYRHEYLLNMLIKHFPKPYVALLHGFVMGGGVGISVHGSHRVAFETMQFAMPETGIGLFPDVGGSFFLPRLPGEIGMYLGLTGARLKMADALYAGIATHVAPAVEREALIARLAAGEMPDNVLGAPGGAIGTPPLAELRTKIDTIFSAPSVEVVLERLERDGTDWAADTAKTIRTKSPTASKLAFRQIREGKALDFDACMRMEFRMVSRVIAAHDFYEGVRATIIDKDGAPKWQPDSLVRVSDTAIEAYFAPLPDDGEPQGALDKVLHIDARGWTQVTDIYDALLAAVDASRNHGCSIDALIDSMVYGGMNGIEAPYTVRVTETAALPPEVREELQLIVDTISGAQGTDGDVAFRIEP